MRRRHTLCSIYSAMSNDKMKTPPVDAGPVHADDFLQNLFQRRHHARFLDPGTVYHVVSRVFQGRFLLSPNEELNAVINGVIGRGRHNWPKVEFFAHAFMSNHVHFMVRGPTHEITQFIGHLKREISRRCSPMVEWDGGTFWDATYLATALPTAESQEDCLKYILSQGVKEGLVEDPVDWPGVHCAARLFAKRQIFGEWFDGTAYGKAKYREERRAEKKRREINRADFITIYEVVLDTIPAWRALSELQRDQRLAAMRRDIIAEGRRLHKKVAGAEAVMKTSRETRSELPKLPWYEDRRRMVLWGSRKAAESQDYLRRYWAFQKAFRVASEAFRSGDLAVEFPEGAFRPTSFAAPALLAA